MRKTTLRNGLRLVLAALLLIILASFYHGGIAALFALSTISEIYLYQMGMFIAAVLGGYGVVLAALGLVLQKNPHDEKVRVVPVFLMIMAAVFLFFYLLAASFDKPSRPERLMPGETITI